jgi:hypothetical protein
MEVYMTEQLNLKEIEKRAFRSTYQDGLWDIYYGLIVVFMSIFIYQPETGYSVLNILLGLGGIIISFLLFRAGKRMITLPRMGMVKFGEIRQKKNHRMSIIQGFFVLILVALIVFTSLGLFNSQIGSWLNKVLGDHSRSLLIVAGIGSLIVGSSMIVMSYFRDFDRGFYISILMAVAVFLMIFLNRPWLPVVIGLVIIIPGVVLLIRFISRYPVPKGEVLHG